MSLTHQFSVPLPAPPQRVFAALTQPQTRVTVIHSGFVRTADVSDYPLGWRGFLQQLKKTLEPAGAHQKDI